MTLNSDNPKTTTKEYKKEYLKTRNSQESLGNPLSSLMDKDSFDVRSCRYLNKNSQWCRIDTHCVIDCCFDVVIITITIIITNFNIWIVNNQK